MKSWAMVFGFLFLALGTLCLVVPDSWLGGQRDTLIIRSTCEAAMWFALAANYPWKKNAND